MRHVSKQFHTAFWHGWAWDFLFIIITRIACGDHYKSHKSLVPFETDRSAPIPYQTQVPSVPVLIIHLRIPHWAKADRDNHRATWRWWRHLAAAGQTSCDTRPSPGVPVRRVRGPVSSRSAGRRRGRWLGAWSPPPGHAGAAGGSPLSGAPPDTHEAGYRGRCAEGGVPRAGYRGRGTEGRVHRAWHRGRGAQGGVHKAGYTGQGTEGGVHRAGHTGRGTHIILHTAR